MTALFFVILLGDFVEEVREMLNDLHKERLADQSSSILALTDMNEDKLISLIKMILQLLLQIKKTSTHSLLFSLVEHLCLKNGCKGFRDDTAFFREKLRMESLHLLATLCKIDVQNKNKPSNCNEHDGINSLDHQVNCIETIRYHCAPLRMQRLKHFVYHLFSIDVITPGNILDISKNNPSLGADLIVKPHSNTRSGNCCDTELPSVVKKMMQNKWYQSLQPIEEKMFWTRIEVALFMFIIHRFISTLKTFFYKKNKYLKYHVCLISGYQTIRSHFGIC